MKLSQKEKIRMKLEMEGYISRNYCVRTFLSYRLGARILELRQEGYDIEGKEEDGDFIYRLKVKPERQLQLI
jgi:hypothetical protein